MQMSDEPVEGAQPDPNQVRWAAAKDFLNKRESLELAIREVSRIETSLANARIAFGKAMVPEGAEKGDKYNIWLEEYLFEVEVLDTSGNGTYSVSVWDPVKRAFLT